ncbi:MAG: hypothetical protein QM763_00715 [Agriterribacter sp.]
MFFTSSLSRALCTVLVSSVLIISCKKDSKKSEAQTEADVTAASASATAYSVLNTALDIMFVTGSPDDESERATSARKYGCATVTATPGGLINFPKDITVDFGTGCTLRGYTGKGSVSFTLNQWVTVPGTEITPVFNDFFVNDYKIEGSYKITTISATEFKVDIIDGLVTFPDKTVYHLTGTLNYTQTKGSATPLAFEDDTYSVTGDITSTSFLGEIEGTITTPLIMEISCNNITSGTIDFTTENTTATLDFGDGTCDNKGTIKTGSLSFPVTLPL